MSQVVVSSQQYTSFSSNNAFINKDSLSSVNYMLINEKPQFICFISINNSNYSINHAQK